MGGKFKGDKHIRNSKSNKRRSIMFATKSISCGLLNIVNKNNNKDRQNISIFEIGPVFTGIHPGEQKDCLTIVRSGKMQ